MAQIPRAGNDLNARVPNPLVPAAGANAGAPGAGAPAAAPRVPNERERLEKICNDAAVYFQQISLKMQDLIAELQGLAEAVNQIVDHVDAMNALQDARASAASIASGIPEARRQCREALRKARSVIENPLRPIAPDRLGPIQGLMNDLENLLALGDGNVVGVPRVAAAGSRARGQQQGQAQVNRGVPHVQERVVAQENQEAQVQALIEELEGENPVPPNQAEQVQKEDASEEEQGLTDSQGSNDAGDESEAIVDPRINN